MSTTTNLGLTKPASSDNVSLTVINGNYDIIDAFAGTVPVITANPTGTFQNDLTTITIGSDSYNVGTSSVSGMSDVALTTPTNGQVLKFNSTTAKWENANETGGSVSVNDLTDTAIASVTNGQVLTYNSVSNKWVNADAPSGGGGSIYIPTNVTYEAGYTGTPTMTGNYSAALTKYVNGSFDSSVTLTFTDILANTRTKDLDDVQIGFDSSSQNTYVKALDDTISYNNNYFNTGDTIISALVSSETYNLSLVEELTPTEVSWSQVVNTGTKIATITINNTPTDVYAPTSGGASALSGLSDVNISSVSDGQFLTYDSTSSKWNNESVTLGDTVNVSQIQSTGTKIATVTVNGTGTDIYAPTSGGATSLSGLSDVDLTTPSDGQVLTYDNANSKWINANASGGASDLNDLSDVTITSVSNGQILKYNSSSSKWENVNAPSSGTWTDVTGTLTAGQTSITLADGSIRGDSTLDVYTDNNVDYNSIEVESTGYIFSSFMGGKIVVRENENDATDIKLFVVGLTKTTNFLAITDNDLLSYLSDITSGYLKGCETFDTAVSTTQTGILAIGNWGSGLGINTYIPGWTQYKSGTFYGVIDLSESPVAATVTPEYQMNEYSDPYSVGQYSVTITFDAQQSDMGVKVRVS